MSGKISFSEWVRRATALFRKLSQVNEWIIASFVIVFVVLLLIPSFSISLKPAPTPGASPAPAAAGGSPAPGGEPGLVEKRVVVTGGDTLIGILGQFGIVGKDADNLISSLGQTFGPRDLQPGQEINLFLRADASAGFAQLASVRIGVDPTKEVEASLTDNGSYAVQVIPQKLTYKPVLVHGSIVSTLYDSASSAGLPVAVLMEMIRAFSFDVDFQRDIQAGASYEVMYQRTYDKNDRYVGDGPILFAALHFGNSTLKIYRYTTSKGLTDYFDPEGRSVRKTLMRTPIEGAWISSGYGYRMDPIYGYTKFHPALDFAAPIGTPIMAAGDGSVLIAGWSAEYGNFVKLRHKNGYTTLYAHMSAFARGVQRGATVSQGQVIGYVGVTGYTTGPHLHYEVQYNGSYVNPGTVVSPPGPTLTGDELELFQAAKAEIERTYAALAG